MPISRWAHTGSGQTSLHTTSGRCNTIRRVSSSSAVPRINIGVHAHRRTMHGAGALLPSRVHSSCVGLPASVWRLAWKTTTARCLLAEWVRAEIHMVLHDVSTNGMCIRAHHTLYRQRGDSNPCRQSPMDF